MKPGSTLWRCKLELSKWAELKTLPIKGGMKQKWLSSFFPYCDISLWNCFRDVIFPYLYWISAFPDRKSITHMNPRESEKKLCGWGWWSDYICFMCRIRLLRQCSWRHLWDTLMLATYLKILFPICIPPSPPPIQGFSQPTFCPKKSSNL